jgi:inward rectifier potassium channel
MDSGGQGRSPPCLLNCGSMARRKTPHRKVIVSAEPAETATLLGLDEHRFSDVYHHLLTASWPALLLIIAAVFVAINAIFAVVYLLDRGIENARPGSFADVFFFSVQTMATIGYGKLAPGTTLANVMMSVEALTGLLGLAMVTGLVFAKFSRPTARVRFSRVAVISKRDGVPSLMFRMANVRGNRIVDATVHVVLARQEKTLEGEEVRRFFDLALQRYRNSIFSYSWTAIHPITDGSPMHRQTAQSLERASAEVIVSMTGLDESFAQTVHARYSYRPSDIKWGARLADILERTPQGLVIDYSHFDDTVPAA